MIILCIITAIIACFGMLVIYVPRNLIIKKGSINERLDQIARDVIHGYYGNGTDRKRRIDDVYRAGLIPYDYTTIQNRVNEIMITYNRRKKWFIYKPLRISPITISRFSTTVFCIILAFIIFITTASYHENKAIGNATKVTYIYINKSIYYDSDLDKHFILDVNNWNISEIYSRKYIDKDKVEKIIECDEIIKLLS